MSKDINIVLIEPEIPQNTGNIARTCAAIGASLHLIKPLGFSLEEKQVRRAGLDYWDKVDVNIYDSLAEFFSKKYDGQYVYVTTKAAMTYDRIRYSMPVYLFFGKESAGLPEDLLRSNYRSCIRIPMISDARSLNLSNAAAIVCYEILRQHDFAGLQCSGSLPVVKDTG